MEEMITLDDIAQQPGMYLPARTIYALKAYLNGINCEEQSDLWDYLDGFYDWLLDTFNHRSDLGMHCEMKLILHYMSRDPYDAFDRFFELLEQFHAEEEEGLLPVLNDIRQNPYNYLPQRSIYCLYAYFWGKDAAAQGLADPQDMTGFEQFIQQKYELEDTWDRVILFFSQDEFGALNQFQQLYEEFASQPHHASDHGQTNLLPL